MKIDKLYDLSVVIINYRTPEMTIDCVNSLIPELKDINAKVIIVDNASGDDSTSIIRKYINDSNNNSAVDLIQSKKNLGFSGGNNLGINAVNAKYYLLLNSDTIVKEYAIERLMASIQSNSKVGLVTPALHSENGEIQDSCFRYMTPISEFIAAARTGIIYKLLSKYVIPLSITSEVSSPPWSSFACVLIRKEVFDEVGLLDDGFFMYYEDTEFCYRARKANWNIENNPASQVIHLCGKSSSLNEDKKRNKRQPHYVYESRTRYFYTLYGRKGLVMANIYWLLGRMISKTIQIMGRKNKATPRHQWLDIWINFIKPLGNDKK